MRINSNGIVIKNRSTLYNITPIDVGTSSVESLTSYIGRLAEEHCVHVSKLINLLIKPDFIISSKSNFYGISSSQVNSISDISFQMVNILESLTKTHGLKYLTMQPFEHLFTSWKLMKRNKYWCPICLQEMVDERVPIYEKLIWNINYINACEKHNVQLQSICPNCKKTQSHLNPFMRNGYCQKCRKWLGNKNGIIIDDPMSIERVKNVGGIMQEINQFPSRSELSNALAFIKNNLFQVPKEGFCKKNLQMNFNSYTSYIHTETKIEFYSLIKISEFFKIPLVEILTNKIKKNQNENHPPEYSIIVKSSKPRFNKELVENQFKEILENLGESPISIMQVSRELGYAHNTIKQHLPDLYEELKKQNNIRRKIIANKEHQKRIKLIKEEIEKVVNEGKYPSHRLIKKRLPFSFDSFNVEYINIWRETLLKLGITMRPNQH